MKQKRIARTLTRLEIEIMAKEVGIHPREIWLVKSETVLNMIALRKRTCKSVVTETPLAVVFISA